MTELEWLQLGGLSVAAVVGAAAIYGLVRWTRSLDSIFPNAAKKYGLTFDREKTGSAFTNVVEVSRLRGSTNGVPIEVAARYETRGRIRSRSTLIASPATVTLPACTINVSHRAPAATVHRVPTGDPQFDAKRSVTSDAPSAVQALLVPRVRAALLRCPQPDLRLTVHDGILFLSFPSTPTNEAELHGPIEVMLAAARSRFA